MTGKVYLKNKDGTVGESIDIPVDDKQFEMIGYTFYGLLMTIKKEKPETDSVVVEFDSMTWEIKAK